MTFAVMTIKKSNVVHFLLEISQKVHDNFFCNSPRVWVWEDCRVWIWLQTDVLAGSFFHTFPQIAQRVKGIWKIGLRQLCRNKILNLLQKTEVSTLLLGLTDFFAKIRLKICQLKNLYWIIHVF